MTVSEKFLFGTAFLVEVLRKDKLTYTKYETMTKAVKKK